MADLVTRVARLRAAETGEPYLAARRAVLSDRAEFDRLKKMDRLSQNKRRYPFTARDGLDRRHVLSAFETQKRHH